ncbi:C-type mannose receptor 2-like isoform X2 [Orbicella faveolata]|uniref:C-type mannose receptor 2-like isoform X2 n=1 Tax=Orbicella faveolata TaxID=48498 RepID=UPI0009E3F6B8|nr:C-type mannose receptor 2-like isoform X2 [Orbicella faveolata]
MLRARGICSTWPVIILAVMFAAMVSASRPKEACSKIRLPSGKCCVFPFEYNGRQYNECTVDGSTVRPWCATTSNYTQDREWEYCELQQSWCPPGWSHLKNSCVFIKTSPSYYYYYREYGVSSWTSARKACNAKGADLMVVRDLEDLNGLLSMYYTTGEFRRRPLFLGSRENFNLRWQWPQGGVVDAALWGPGEPNTAQYGRCGVIENFERRMFNRGCGWWLAARVCSKTRPYICEARPVNRTCQQGYELIGNHCYKIHTSPRLDWEDAWSDCLSQSGYLAIIDSYEKLQGIVPLLRLVQWPYIFHVGLIRDLGSWSWLDGTSVDSALFEAGYPQKESGETCIAFYGYYPVIINMPCDDLPGVACQSAQATKANVAHRSLTRFSSLATGSNSSFAVDNNSATCFISQKVTVLRYALK